MGEPYKKECETLLENQDAFTKGPYLDVTDAFEKGKCIAELIEEGLLPKSFSKINMNMTRPLYLHQEKAIRKVATENRNLVVSTGTGSGKTESFLIYHFLLSPVRCTRTPLAHYSIIFIVKSDPILKIKQETDISKLQLLFFV